MEKYLKKYQKPLIFEKLNRKMLGKILEYMTLEEISKLNQVCRRFNNLVQSSIQELQVFTAGDYEGYNPQSINQAEFRYVILRHASPGDFFFPYPSFKYLKQVFLCYDDEQDEKINLTKLLQLKYLKIRGANIQLSSNRLPSVTHVDLDDPNTCEKQVFRNVKNFHLEANIEEFSQIHNSTENEALKHIFIKTYDILVGKADLEQISFTVIIHNMDLLIFEQFVDSITTFLNRIGESSNFTNQVVSCRLKHSEYEISDRNARRWDKAWHYLEVTLPHTYPNFDLQVEPLTSYGYIPVD